MKKFQRPDGNPVPNVHVAEVTTPQLIVYICLGLCAFGLFFGLGVITGRLDPSFKSTEETIETAKSEDTETYSMPVTAPGKTPKNRTAVKSETPDSSAQRTPETPIPRNPYMTATPGLTSLQPLNSDDSRPLQIEAPSKKPVAGKEALKTSAPVEAPKNADNSNPASPPAPETQPAPDPQPATTTPAVAASSPASPSPVTSVAPPATETSPTPASSPTTTTAPSPSPDKATTDSKPEDIPLLTPITPDEPPIKKLPMEPESQTAVAKPPMPASTTGRYGIQLAAFTESDRRTRAETLQQKLKKDAGIQAQILNSEDGNVYRVIVGGFPDKESAAKALSDVRAKTGFPEAFIKAL